MTRRAWLLVSALLAAGVLAGVAAHADECADQHARDCDATCHPEDDAGGDLADVYRRACAECRESRAKAIRLCREARRKRIKTAREDSMRNDERKPRGE